MLDFDEDDDDFGDYEIDYGEIKKQQPAKTPSSAPSSSFRGRFSANPSSSNTPSYTPPSSSTPTPKPTGSVFGFLNHTSAGTTAAKKDVFDFSTTRAPSAPPATSVSSSSSSPYKVPPKSNSALDKAERFLNKGASSSNLKTFSSSTSNAAFAMSDDLDDIDEIDAEEVVPAKSSFSISTTKPTITKPATTKPSSSNFTMSSDEEDLDIEGQSESEEEVPIKSTSSALKSFNLKTVDGLIGTNILFFFIFHYFCIYCFSFI